VENTFTFKSATGLGPIFAREYPTKNPRGIVQVCHGMFEHFGRYENFARFMNERGYMVAGFDMAGHGRSTPDAPRGFFGDKDGFLHLVEDIHTFKKKVSSEYGGVPYFLMGHSMGSLLARSYCTRFPEGLCGAIFMGSSGIQRMKTALGQVLPRALPKTKPSMFFRRMAFSGFNKTYPRPRETFSWISRDADSVKSYQADSLRIETFTARGYFDLSELIRDVSESSWFDQMPKNLPLLFLSGDDDPVGGYGRGVRQVAERLMDEGAYDVNVMLYPGARHELLNEINKDEVMFDILAWLNLHASQAQKEK